MLRGQSMYRQHHLLHLFHLLLLLLAVHLVAVAQVVHSQETKNVVENKKFTFSCQYDSEADSRGDKDLGVTIQECDDYFGISDQLKQAAVAIAIGDAVQSWFKETSSDGEPLFYKNAEHQYVKSKEVEILPQSNVQNIELSINATAQLNGKCIFCGQMKGRRDYTNTKTKIVVLSPPIASMKMNDALVTAGSSQDIDSNVAVNIQCSAEGNGGQKVELSRDNVVLASSDKAAEYSIASANRSHAGNYKCKANSDHPDLIANNANMNSIDFTLRVKFKPEFNLEDSIHYTPVGQQKAVEVKVDAYPEPQLTCQNLDNTKIEVRESYNPQKFFTQYKLLLTNAESEQKETEFKCTATNSVGSTDFDIKLTAKAPTPNIVSPAASKWYNSHHLKWKHHKDADVDKFHIEVDGNDNKQTLVHQPEDDAIIKGNSRHHAAYIFNLTANADYEVKVKACNKHGCSDFTKAQKVRTADEKPENYHDPNNPKRPAEVDAGNSGMDIKATTWTALLVATLAMAMAGNINT